MNAQPQRPFLPTPERRRAPRPAQRQTRQPHRWLAIETTAKLTVNILLSVAAVSTLVKILPYQFSQQEKLQEVRSEVSATEARVGQLRTEFSRYFDPKQTTGVMQEQSNRISANQRQVIWLDPEKTTSSP